MKNNTDLRILAAGEFRDNNTRNTGLNNNDLIIGPSGAGKTRGYVKPNLLQCQGSVIVADTKGSLLGEVGPSLRKRGYKVLNIDFTDLALSCGYNPLDFIRRDPRTGRWSEQDIMTVSNCLCPVESTKDPFWDQAAQMYLSSMIGYALEALPPEEHTLDTALALLPQMSGNNNFAKLMEERGAEDPTSFAYQKYLFFKDNRTAEKMDASIRGILAAKTDSYSFDGPTALYRAEERIDFAALGREKTAVFLTVSDTDRSLDRLVNLFYTQALQVLCRSADKDYPDHRLPIPVRFILDDFATNTVIPDFDNIISVIRSREISVSVIIQSISQLMGLYGESKSLTILNNCDNCLYLGGQDVETARYIAVKANRSADSILNLPLGDAYLFTRGQAPKRVRKFDILTHEAYGDLPEAGDRLEKEVGQGADSPRP